MILITVKLVRSYKLRSSAMNAYILNNNNVLFIQREDLLVATLAECKQPPPSEFEYPHLISSIPPAGPFLPTLRPSPRNIPANVFPAIDQLVNRLQQNTVDFQPLTPVQIHAEGIGDDIDACRIYLNEYSHCRQSKSYRTRFTTACWLSLAFWSLGFVLKNFHLHLYIFKMLFLFFYIICFLLRYRRV